MVDQLSLDARFLENLEALREHFPSLYDFYVDYKEDQYVLVFDSNGDYNIYDLVSECNVYPVSPLEYCAKTYKEFEQSPLFFSKLLGGASELASLVNPVHTKYVKSLAGVSLAHETLYEKKSEFPDKINSMLFLGVGAGHDVEHILNEKVVSNLYILERNPDIFYASLFLIDWKSIIEKFSENKKNITIIIDENEESLISRFYKTVVSYGHHNANSLYIYSPLDVDSYSDLFGRINDVIRGRLLAGFGFYDDSRLSVASTISNVKNKIPIYIKKDDMGDMILPNSTPVFVVGAGPSLDKDIDFIKNNEGKAIIISCGSGIKPLEKHGITPDFHFECERTAFTKHWLDQVDPEFLKKVNFIGLNLIFPDVYKMFNKTAMLTKSNETGSFMLAKAVEKVYGKSLLPMHTHVNPTVVHMGVGVAPFLGFKRLYLFGTDMGYKDPLNHHSKDSSYSDVKDDKQNMFMPTSYREVDSNFEGELVYSDDGYTSFRLFLEGIISANKNVFKDFECFNCSDGSLIKGATPQKDRDFLSDDSVLDKKSIVETIMTDYFDTSCCEEIESALDAIVKEDIHLVSDICSEMSSFFDVEFHSIAEASDALDNAVKKLFYSDLISDDKAYLLSLFNGSMLYMFSTMVRIIYSRSGSEQDILKSANSGFKILSSFFDTLGNDFSSNYSLNDDISLYDLF